MFIVDLRKHCLANPVTNLLLFCIIVRDGASLYDIQVIGAILGDSEYIELPNESKETIQLDYGQSICIIKPDTVYLNLSVGLPDTND